ncbi:methionine--tRNA ligase [Candidatus Falkowbacteria bacterium]|jgi:methionyl-tRNA synthetase|nr:methionine--tRNA ligase [Candidatus Falkowbacteria bacterium]MBT6574069.1 methionine--tRNA ligase [Candidatus Falkowbacteria bacterium]MBT7348227.1 methionine--tRNA ligase [Candidatus Falkowbacteria bacterium]MBT7500206.1 methionine--tRNA ligase [Candidatus Falkowbacteria bacterium]
MEKNKFYITTPIYYVNDKPHIGHAYTTIVADVLARYNRFKLGSDKVWFLTGTDEHGAKVAQSAKAENKEPQIFVDEVSAEFKSAWGKLNISFDDFIRTTEDRHEKVVGEVLTKLKSAKTPKGNDFIFKDTYEGLYCVGCEAYKKEDDLVEGKCPDHNKEPQTLSEENWYIKLSDYADVLKKKIESDEIKILPADKKKEVLSFIEHGLEDIAVSRANVDWGIPVPFDKKQTIYVWVDALINYISALGFPSGENFKEFWPADTHLLAKDILKFHCIIWPVMLLAAEIEQPKELFVHGFFTLNGKKMSKTLGNVIDPNDLVEEYGADAARYLIISQFVFGQDGDVKVDEFPVKFNADLANGIGNLTSRVLSMAEKYCDSKVPNKKFDTNLDLKKTWQKIDKGFTDYKIFENLREVWDVISWCDGYIDKTKPWVLGKENKQTELDQVIYNLLEILRHLGWLLKPILPETSAEILMRLGEDELAYEEATKVGRIKPGTKVEKGEPLFIRK